MSVTLLPGIGGLDPESLCYSIYTQLYQNFFNAQNTGAVAEGDQTSIRLRNTAFGFAEAISGAVDSGGGTGGGVLADYLKLSGGNLTGLLRADYGFTAGIGNSRVLEVFDEEGLRGVRITGQLRVDGDGLLLGGRQVLTYHSDTNTTEIDCAVLSLGDTLLKTGAGIQVGDVSTGVRLTSTSVLVGGHVVYHGGNANNAATDWTMKDAAVAGVLTVEGGFTMNGPLRACHGVFLGDAGNTLLDASGGTVGIHADLDILGSHAIRFGDKPVLSLSGVDRLMIATPGGDLLLGGEPTPRVRLMAPLADQQGTRTLLTATGGGYFPESLRVSHNFGPDLLSTFELENGSQGIAVPWQLRFGADGDAFLVGTFGQLAFVSQSDHTSEPEGAMSTGFSILAHVPSTSLFAPKDRLSDSLMIVTEGDFIFLGNRTEVQESIGISGTVTRLQNECLFLTDIYRLQAVVGGIKHYGQGLFTDGISSELFSSGFAGSGWAILYNGTTGTVTATFDEIIVRRKMRAYELEVQQTRSSNGALWISDSCSGDSVEKL